MISEDLVKQRFVHDTISQGINLIYQTQEKVVRTYLNTRSGRLLSSLQRRPFTIQESEGKQEYFIRIFHISVILIFDIDGETTGYHVISEVIWLCIIVLFGEFFIMKLSRNCVMAIMKLSEVLSASN